MVASYLKRTWWLLVALMVCAPAVLDAQYFGRNKVQYRSFDFQVLRTDHFDLYYYPEEAEAAAIVARMAERWHARLSRFFGHDLRGRQPLILYASSAHFRQTNAVEGLIGEGTGGVTEALKRRVVLPVGGSLADTDHVLGHELVHAFQFDLTGDDVRDAGFSAPGVLAFPLWFVEGMAEYLSLGSVDAHTAMWLRDAALQERLPHVRDLDAPEYFPYRWGHAFWAYVGGRYGDGTVASLIRSAANPRHDLAGLMRQLGTDPDTFTQEWHAAILESARAMADELPSLTSRPRLVIGRETHGARYNIGPELSPDGSRIAFFSERGQFSIDLFVADVETGRVVRRLSQTATDPHFDSLEFLNSAGAWSPDGRTLAVTATRAGRPVLVQIAASTGRVLREIALELDDAFNPSFAPDGGSVVLSGNRGGLVDLYRLTLDSAALERLTSDAFADLQAVFTPDGASLVFVTERFTTDLALLAPAELRLAVLNLSSREVRPLAAFLRGKQINPRILPGGRAVVFIADPDGVSNLYRIGIDGGPAEQLTAVGTGIAGITSRSPAMSVAAETGRMAFSLFEEDGHAIYVLDPAHVVALVPPPADVLSAALPGRAPSGGEVQRLLEDASRGLPSGPSVASEPYRDSLALDAVGQPIVSAGISQRGGGFISGGVSAFFSDMLGDRGLGVAAEVAGSVADVGGQLTYTNRRHRWNWGGALYASPYRIGYYTRMDAPDSNETTLVETIERQPRQGGQFVAALPLDTATRLEVATGAERLAFTRETRTATYDRTTRRLVGVINEREQIGPPLYLADVRAALVRDTSFFGVTSPIHGERFRFDVGHTAGSLRFTTALADWRRYVMVRRPVTVAVRALHVGRYGRDAEDPRLVALYLGYPELVHGYGVGSFTALDCLRGGVGGECPTFRNLLGSRLFVANAEVRAPLVGLFTGRLDYGRLPIEVAAFVDAGLAWTASEQPAFANGSRTFMRSAGGAMRVNLLGVLAVEVSAARALDRPSRGLHWQVGIRQGF